jgi:hypothetical protein
MNKTILKWIGIYAISILFLCLDLYAVPAQPDTTKDTSGMHRSSSSHLKSMNKKRLDSTSVMHKSSMTDTSTTHKKKMSTKTGMMMRPPKSESDFVSGMTRYLNRRVKLNSDQVDKVHQILTDYFTVARSNINNVNNTIGNNTPNTPAASSPGNSTTGNVSPGNTTTGNNTTGSAGVSSQNNNNMQIYVGTHNPVDTTSYVSPYISLNHSSGTANTYGTTSGSGKDTGNAMYNQRAGAKTNSGTDSTNASPRTGQNITSNTSVMSSGSLEERSVELDQSGLKVGKQIESLLTDRQLSRFASIRDDFIDLLRQQALTVKSE